MPPVGSLRTFFPLALLASILFAGASGCSSAGDGSIAVQLVYPPAGAAAAGRASVRAASYATDPADRIRIRVLGPHFAPIERWFLRSDGRGEIGGIPPGARIAVEVDEYDPTAVPSANAVLAAPLLGRGWSNGIALSPGEVKTVTIAMYARGTIVTVCGAPASGGSGTSGDTGDGGLDNEAYLGNPTAVKAGPDDSIYVSSSAFRKVKRIDRYGYLSDFAGDGTHGTITPGTPASSAPIGAVQDIDIDPAGNLYLFNDFNQIVRVDNGVVNKLVYDNGVYDSVARFNLAVVNVDLVYFVNYLENRVYRVSGTSKSDYVTDNNPYDTTEPISRLNYPLRAPSSIAYAPMSDSLIFADTDNDRIMRLSFADLNIYYLVANAGGTRFSEGIDPLAMAPSRPRVVDYNPITGKIFFVEGLSDQVLYIDALGKVRLFAGTGSPGFSGDGGPATAAGLNDPRAIAVDSRGNAYIADYGNHAIRMVVGGALP
ncbi:MAG: NHL repeat-containing protein [Desulfobacteria bacterium]